MHRSSNALAARQYALSLISLKGTQRRHKHRHGAGHERDTSAANAHQRALRRSALLSPRAVSRVPDARAPRRHVTASHWSAASILQNSTRYVCGGRRKWQPGPNSGGSGNSGGCGAYSVRLVSAGPLGRRWAGEPPPRDRTPAPARSRLSWRPGGPLE